MTERAERHADWDYCIFASMTARQIYDVPGGDPVTYMEFDKMWGLNLCAFNADPLAYQAYFENLPDLKLRDDDVMMMAYPKCGTHWLWEILSLVFARSDKLKDHMKVHTMLEAGLHERFDAYPSPRILNTHLKPELLPKDFLSKKLKSVFLYRNPKDVAVSFYYHTKGIHSYNYDGKFENFLQLFMRDQVEYGKYTSYLLEWQKFIRTHPEVPVHILSYEDLQKDCLTEVKRVCTFLGEEVENELLESIVESCHIDRMKSAKSETLSTEVRKRTEIDYKEGFFVYRKGEVGGWKNYFTPALNDQFDQWWREETKDLDMFKFTYEM